MGEENTMPITTQDREAKMTMMMVVGAGVRAVKFKIVINMV